MAVVSSCSSGSSNASEEAVTAPTATSSPAAATSSTRTTTAGSTAAAAVDPSKLDGILVAVQPTDKDPLEIGTIDPTTGDYTKVGTFPNGAIGPNWKLSPDLTRAWPVLLSPARCRDLRVGGRRLASTEDGSDTCGVRVRLRPRAVRLDADLIGALN